MQGAQSFHRPPLTLVVNRLPRHSRLVPEAHGLVTLAEDQRAATRVAAGDFAWVDAPAPWPALGIAT